MPNFDLNAYETVESRIKRFYSDHEKGTITTELLSDPNHLDTAVVKATLWDDWGNTLLATGMAFEQLGQGFVNKTSHLENAETSAIGRALANYNYSGDKRPSREEMVKTQGNETRPAQPKPNASKSEELFQLLAANKEKFSPDIGKVMNAALKLRAEDDVAGLQKIAEEYGLADV